MPVVRFFAVEPAPKDQVVPLSEVARVTAVGANVLAGVPGVAAAEPLAAAHPAFCYGGTVFRLCARNWRAWAATRTAVGVLVVRQGLEHGYAQSSALADDRRSRVVAGAAGARFRPHWQKFEHLEAHDRVRPMTCV